MGALTPAAVGRSRVAVSLATGALRAVAPSRLIVVIGCLRAVDNHRFRAFFLSEWKLVSLPRGLRTLPQPCQHLEAGIAVGRFDPDLALISAHRLHGVASDP